jgi:hypothetical protein
VYELLVGKPEGKRPLSRRRLRCVDNIKMDPVRLDGVVWTELTALKIGASRELL